MLDVSKIVISSVKILLAVIIVGATITITRYYGEGMSSKLSQISTLAASQQDGLAKSLNGTVASGADVVTLVNSYYNAVPILIVTDELYYNSSQKYSYNVTSVSNRKSAEYINPRFEYFVEVNFDQKDQIVWIRVVQEDIRLQPDLATISSTSSEYAQRQAEIELHNTLIQKQYEIYLKDR